MEREQIAAWMKRRNVNNRQLANMLGITEDKVSKSLSQTGKPRLWKADEALKLADLIRSDNPLVRTEVRGTGMSADETRNALFSDERRLGVVGTAFGGDWDELEGVEMTELHLSDVLYYLNRPGELAGDAGAYALEIVGESMAHRYEPGDRVFVSPRAPVRPGDDVIVQVRGTGEEQVADRVTMVLIKRLVRRTATHIELRQFNPETTFKVPISRVARDSAGTLAIHRVMGRI